MSNKYFVKYEKILALLLCIVIFFGIFSSSNFSATIADGVNNVAPQEHVVQNKLNYVTISENSGLKFIADTKTGAFVIQNKQTGKNWYSTPTDIEFDEITIGSTRTEIQSQVVIRYLYKEDELVSQALKTTNSYIECEQSDNISTEIIKDGMIVKYNFADIGVVIPVIYTLSELYLTAEVDFKNIKTNDNVYLASIQLLPAFGANNTSSDGYLFVPDGCGAVIKFDNGIDSEIYDSMVYGNELAIPADKKTTQTETVRMPVFGIKDNNDGIFAIITKGDKNSSIVAYNKNSTCGYDFVSSRRVIRRLTQKTIYENDPANRQDIGRITDADLDGYAVRYYFLSGDNADYVGMASVYRKYLIDECGLSKKPADPAFALDIYGAIDRKASFLGIPYTAKEKLTTYAQAQAMLEALKKEGISDIAVRYRGWTGDGLLNIRKLKSAKPISLLGGRKEYSKLLDYVGENSVELYSDVDLLQYRKGSNSSAIKTSFDQVSKQHHYLRSVYSPDPKTTDVKLLSFKLLNRTAKSVLKPFDKLDESNISLNGVGSSLYSDFSGKDFISRSEAGEQIIKVLTDISKKGKAIALDGGNIFTVPYAQRVFDVPVSSGNYDIFNADVPFYQIVLHGYVTMSGSAFVQSAEPLDSFLRSVETGTELHYGGMFADSSVVTGTQYDDLFSSTYNLWIKTAAEQYSKYMPILEQIYDKSIITHEKLAEDVFKTTFENGVQVVVNYSDKEFNLTDINVGAKDFVQLSKGGAG